MQLSIDKNEKIRTKSLKVASKMAQYTFCPKEEKIYYYPQIFISDAIKKLQDEKLLVYFNLILTLSKELLSHSYQGISPKDHRTITLYQGPLPAENIIKTIREKTISSLKKLYSLTKTTPEKQQILQALGQATGVPKKNTGQDFKKIVLENTNDLISYYLSIVRESDNTIIRIIEEQLYRSEENFPKGLNKAGELKSHIKKNEKYDIFKVFVGYDYDFPNDLDSSKDSEKEREIKMNKYIERVNRETYFNWQKDILSIAKSYEDIEDKGEFHSFKIFLNKLGKQKPEFAQKLILENEEELGPFLAYLIAGLWESKQEEAKGILEGWIEEGKYLSHCAFMFEYVQETDENLLNEIYKKARGRNDTKTLTIIMHSIVTNFEKSKKGKNLFINCIKELKKSKGRWWTSPIIRFRGRPIFETLNEKDWSIVFENLLVAPRINCLEILFVAAKNFPKELVRFSYERTKIEEQKNLKEEYDAIPFNLEELKRPLNQNATTVIEEIFQWFQEGNAFFYLKGGYFLQAIFPRFHQELEKQLIKLLKSKNKNKADVVLYVLNSYRGETFLHNVCKELIEQYPKNQKYKQQMFIILSRTPVVWGDYGIVEAHESKKEEIQEWKKDKSKVIQDFAQEYEQYLCKKITSEKKMIDDEVEIRKREFES